MVKSDEPSTQVSWSGRTNINYTLRCVYYSAGLFPDIKDLTFYNDSADNLNSVNKLDAARSDRMSSYALTKTISGMISVQLTNGYGEAELTISNDQEFYNAGRSGYGSGRCIKIDEKADWIIADTVTLNSVSEPTYTFSVGGGNILWSIGSISPVTDATHMLGSSDKRWNSVYSAQGVITSSDKNLKDKIEDISSNTKLDSFFDELRPVTFVFTDGDSGRRHSGFIAQEIEQSLLKNNIDTHDFAGLVIDPNSKRYGLRYSEFISLNTDQIQKLKKRITELEERLAKLEKGE